MRVCGIRDPFDGWSFRKLLPCLLLGIFLFGCGTVVGYFVWDGKDPRELTMEQAVRMLGRAPDNGSTRALAWLIQDKCLEGVTALKTLHSKGGPISETARVYLAQIRKAVE